jgi:hypothetical protein
MIKKLPPLELLIWVLAFFLLAMATPGDSHFTLCPLANLGWSWCPGCGLGRSIIHLLHGNFHQSFQQHWLAIPALAILISRTVQLSRQFILSLKTTNKA